MSEGLQLAVGDRVVYPNQGVCLVSAIEVKEVAGQKLTFVTMRREEDGAVVMVPQAKVAAIGVRKVATAEEVSQIYSFLRSDSDKADLDWKQRAHQPGPDDARRNPGPGRGGEGPAGAQRIAAAAHQGA